MQTTMYSIYDNVTRLYQFPFHAHNDGDAKRIAGKAFQNPGTIYAFVPSNFELHEICKFDDTTGKVVSPLDGSPKYVASCDEILDYYSRLGKDVSCQSKTHTKGSQ